MVTQETLNLLTQVRFLVPVIIMAHSYWSTPEGQKKLNESEALLRIEYKIDDWHGGEADDPLHEYLGWTEDEYKKFLEDNVIPEREYE